MAVVADVFDVILIDKNNDVIGTTTLQDASIEITVQESEVRGGKKNQLLGTLHSDRDITINLTDVYFRYDWIAKQLGQPITTGAGVAYAMPKWYKVEDDSGSKVITLDETPDDPASVAIYDAEGTKLALTTDFTVSSDEITIIKAGINVGDELEVRTYTYATDVNTKTIEIDNSVFASGVKVILETLEIDENEEIELAKLQYQFDKALPSGNFTINTASAREAVTHAFNLRVVKPKTSNTVGRVLRIPL